MAERQRERAHDPQAVGDPRHVRCVLCNERRQRRLEREDLDPVLRPLPAERLAAEERALASPRRPLLAGAEVVDVAEVHVVHPLAFGDSDRQREVRDPPLRVQRAVDRVDHHDGLAVAEPAGLLADDRHVEIAEAREDHLLGRTIAGYKLTVQDVSETFRKYVKPDGLVKVYAGDWKKAAAATAK